jgi:hypothetical protein
MENEHTPSVGRTGVVAGVLAIAIALVCMVSMSCSRSAHDRPTLMYFNAKL